MAFGRHSLSLVPSGRHLWPSVVIRLSFSSHSVVMWNIFVRCEDAVRRIEGLYSFNGDG